MIANTTNTKIRTIRGLILVPIPSPPATGAAVRLPIQRHLDKARIVTWNPKSKSSLAVRLPGYAAGEAGAPPPALKRRDTDWAAQIPGIDP